MRRRVEPVDRRCYGFFHPANDGRSADLRRSRAHPKNCPAPSTRSSPRSARRWTRAEATCAIFYSINNCRTGLKGIPFGNYLIKRVVGLLQEELPQLSTFATLSPVPGFAKWLGQGAGRGPEAPCLGPRTCACWAVSTSIDAKGKGGQPLDPVARFHLGNGARLEAIHANADLSENGQRQAHGVMVNYVYDLGEIEANHFALTELGTVVTSKAVQALFEDVEPKDGKDKKGGKKKDKSEKDAVPA